MSPQSKSWGDMFTPSPLNLVPGLQTTARETISSGPRSHFANDEKIIYRTYKNFFHLVEYNIYRNNLIA